MAEAWIYNYVVFAILMLATVMVPICTKVFGPKQNKAEYVFATTSKVSMATMMISLLRGVLGVRSLLGYPAEMYYNGTQMYEILYSLILAYPMSLYLFIPIYYDLGITSVYQYLDMRFKSPTVRSLASGLYIIRNILNTGVTVFTPCVALKIILGFPYWVSIVGVTTISIICAFMGGLKAVIVTDVLQGMISLICLLTIVLKGIHDVGGVREVINVNQMRGRFRFFNFDFDPHARVTTVSAFVGQLFISTFIFACQQSFVQRYYSLGSMKRVKKTLWSNLPITALIFTLCWGAGAVIYANYADCDPLTLGYITKIDEIVPFYVENTFKDIPGIIGIFMAALCNGSLSLTVSNLNSMATVAWEDFVCKVPSFKNFKDQQQLLTIKLLAITIGILVIGIAFGISQLPGLIESAQLVTSTTSGPLLGVFVLAMFFPPSNWKGAASGMISSMAFTLILMFGRLLTKKGSYDFLPLSTAGCRNDSFSGFKYVGVEEELHPNVTAVQYLYSEDPPHELELSSEESIWLQIFGITFMYYSALGTLTCVSIGLIVSYITGTSETEIYNKKLIHPMALKISNYFPGKPRKYLKESTESGKKENSDEELKSETASTEMSFKSL